MPEISRFLGIVIAMYYNDHAPPHFHAKYGAFEITVRIADGFVEGQFPQRALNLVLEWYSLIGPNFSKTGTWPASGSPCIASVPWSDSHDPEARICRIR